MPQGNSKKRGFVGRIWAEDQNYGIVRFKGTFISRGRAKCAHHFDSWRLNTQGTWWMPAYVSTEKFAPYDPSHKFWFKAQSRVWGYDLRNASDRPENARQTGPPNDLPDETIYSPENTIVRRLQAAGLMAPDGQVNRILETVVNNILILSHEGTSTYLTSFALPFPDSLIPLAIDFHFSRTQETDADKKAMELFSKSPYKDQFVIAGLFLNALESDSGRFPILLHGPFSHDFGSSHLARTHAPFGSIKPPKADRLDRISALPIGSRIVVDPWSDRIEMTKSKPVPLLSKAEKIPFEVTPFYPYLKRLDASGKSTRPDAAVRGRVFQSRFLSNVSSTQNAVGSGTDFDPRTFSNLRRLLRWFDRLWIDCPAPLTTL